MVREDKATWKANYFIRLVKLFEEYPKCFIVGVDNVGSMQMQHIRMALRGHAEILMGKNTLIRKAIRGHLENNPVLEKLLPYIKGNVGFVFTNEDLSEVKKSILDNKVKAPARAGAWAPVDVVIPAQNTGLGPEKTSFFQALSIPTKISKGTIEILNPVQLIKVGDRVGASEATLLNMLNISPFTYGLKIEQGTVFSPSILDISDDDLRRTFMEGVCNIAGVSLSIGYPTVASVPHSIINGFNKCLAIAVETDITFKEAEMAKEYLKDPSKFASAAPVAAVAKAADAPAAEAKKDESEESDDDMGFGLIMFDFLADVLDEIALEGLDGIALSALWIRLTNRPGFTIALDDNSKAFLWRAISIHPDLDFYQLPHPRLLLILFNRYDHRDPETGMCLEVHQENAPEDIYPIKIVEDKEFRGSCTTFESRTRITDLIRDKNNHLMTYDDITDKYGETLVVVASQKLRTKLLLGLTTDPQLELSNIQYVMLEMIARSREHGIITTGQVCSFVGLKESPKSLFYHRKLLMKKQLIKRQLHFQRNKSTTQWGFVFHQPRFYVERPTAVNLMLQRLCTILQKKPSKREQFATLRSEAGIPETTFKKILARGQPLSQFTEVITVRYREMYPDAPDNDALSAKKTERLLKVVQLVKPFSWNSLSEEGDADEDDEEFDPSFAKANSCDASRLMLIRPIVCQAYDIFYKHSPEGLSERELQTLLGVTRLDARSICRYLQRANIVATYMKDRGQERKKILDSEIVEENMAKSGELTTEPKSVPVTLTNRIIRAADANSEKKPTRSRSVKNQANPKDQNGTPVKKTDQDTKNLTARQLSRANFILETVRKQNFVDDIYKIQRALSEKESKEGCETKLDKRSVMTLVQKLANDGYIKSIVTTLKLGDSVKKVIISKLHFVCMPEITQESHQVQSALHSAKLRLVGLKYTDTKKIYESTKKVRCSEHSDQFTEESFVEQEEDTTPALPKAEWQNKTVEMKFNPGMGKIYGLLPKFCRAQVLHEFLFYLIYDYKGVEKVPQAASCSDEIMILDEKTIDDQSSQPTVYCECKDWKMFLPPLPSCEGYHPGWCLVSDFLQRLPISIFVQIVNIPFKIEGFCDVLNNPIKKHYLISDLPIKLRNSILMSRRYIFHITEILSKLSFMGLVSFGPQIHKDKDQVYIYVHRKASVLDTRNSDPGHYTISPNHEYHLRPHDLDTLTDVQNYWIDMKRVCLNTPLGRKITDHDDSAPKLEMRIECKTVDQIVDDGRIPGDHIGAGGLDSSLCSYLKRNWQLSQSIEKVNVDYYRKKKQLKEKNPNVPLAILFDQIKSQVMNQSQRNQKLKLDSKDHAALALMRKHRSTWSSQEDTFLLLCKVTSVLMGKHRIACSGSIVRDELGKYCPKCEPKTSAASLRRFNSLLKNIKAKHFLSVMMEEARQHESLSSLDKSVHGMGSEEWNKEFLSILKKVIKIFTEKKSLLLQSLPSTYEELKDKFTITFSSIDFSNSKKNNHFNPKNVVDVYCNAAFNMILVSVNSNDLHCNWSYHLCKLFQQYRENLLRAVLTKMRRSRIISMEKKHHLNLALHTTPSYRISVTFKNLININRYQSQIFEDGHLLYSKMIEATSHDNPFVHISPNSAEGNGMVLQALMASKRVILRIEVPTQIIDVMNTEKPLPDQGIPKDQDDTLSCKDLVKDNSEVTFSDTQKSSSHAFPPSRLGLVLLRKKSFSTPTFKNIQHAGDNFWKKSKKIKNDANLSIDRFCNDQGIEGNEKDLHIAVYDAIKAKKLIGISHKSIYDEIKPVEINPLELKKILICLCAKNMDEWSEELEAMHSKGEELQQKMPAYHSVVVGSVVQLKEQSLVVVRVGVRSHLYVIYEYAHPWLMRTLVVPKAKKLLANVGAGVEGSPVVISDNLKMIDLATSAELSNDGSDKTDSIGVVAEESVGTNEAVSMNADYNEPAVGSKKRRRKIKPSHSNLRYVLNDKECVKIDVVGRPWHKPDGFINKKTLYSYLESLSSFICVNPGSSEENIVIHFSPFLQSVYILDLLEMLYESGCIKKMFLQKETKGFGPFFECTYDLTEEDGLYADREILYEPEVDILLKIARIKSIFELKK
ncbi:60S acidic ribosomal protein P0 [Nymphon striatum]|nr:60S acidic ribosomal protein P0 [Nymphon striatum]